MKSAQLWVVTLLMCVTAVVLQVRGDVDRVPPSRPLDELPRTIGVRVARDIPLDPEQLAVLGKGVFLERQYEAPPAAAGANNSIAPPMNLYIGYFPTQRTGQAIHSPQNCLPGSGYVFLSSGVTDLTDPSGKRYSVGEYLVSNGVATDEVLYWYRVHGRSVANDYKAKLYTLADSIRYARTDAALIRVITQVSPGEDRAIAHQRAVDFADQIIPLLPAYIPD
jgi:EpsI family protein